MKTKLNMRVFFGAFLFFGLNAARTTKGALPEIMGAVLGCLILAAGVAAVWTVCTRKKAKA